MKDQSNKWRTVREKELIEKLAGIQFRIRRDSQIDLEQKADNPSQDGSEGTDE